MAVELANFIPESANHTTDSVKVGQLSILNMFGILNQPDLGDRSQPTNRVGRRQIGLVGMGLETMVGKPSTYTANGISLRETFTVLGPTGLSSDCEVLGPKANVLEF